MSVKGSSEAGPVPLGESRKRRGLRALVGLARGSGLRTTRTVREEEVTVRSRILVVSLACVALAGAWALAGCGRGAAKPPRPPATSSRERSVAYTVPATQLRNPEGRPVYVCPMYEHRDQVSLNPEARCRLCGMKLEPLPDARRAWAKQGLVAGEPEGGE